MMGVVSTVDSKDYCMSSLLNPSHTKINGYMYTYTCRTYSGEQQETNNL